MLTTTRKRTLSTIIAGIILLSPGCRTYGTTDPSSIKITTPTSQKSSAKNINYNELNWKESIRAVKTPEQAQKYLNQNFKYDHEESGLAISGLFSIGCKGETFKYNHKRKKGICYDYATTAAALLSDNNYPPLLLGMYENIFKNHMTFLYRNKTGYGIVSNTKLEGTYSSIEKLIQNLNRRYGCKFTKYNITNLDDNYQNKEWVNKDIDLRPKLPLSKNLQDIYKK